MSRDGKTVRDVWGHMGLGPASPELPQVAPKPRATSSAAPEAPAPPTPPGPEPARDPERVTSPRVARAVGKSSRAKERPAERPGRLQINITARAEDLIRSAVEAKRRKGLRGHEASITVVVEEALERSYGSLIGREA